MLLHAASQGEVSAGLEALGWLSSDAGVGPTIILGVRQSGWGKVAGKLSCDCNMEEASVTHLEVRNREGDEIRI